MILKPPLPITQKIRRRDRGYGRSGEVVPIPRHDENRFRRLRHSRQHLILEIRERETPRVLPASRFEIPDLKMAQHLIHRGIGLRFGGVFADKIVERRQSVGRADTSQRPRSDQAHHSRGRGMVWLTLLEDIQKHVDVQSDLHACF